MCVCVCLRICNAICEVNRIERDLPPLRVVGGFILLFFLNQTCFGSLLEAIFTFIIMGFDVMGVNIGVCALWGEKLLEGDMRSLG